MPFCFQMLLQERHFLEKILALPSERFNPGYYTHNIFVALPFIYDIANKSVQVFKQKYIEKYADTPDWRAAFAYDAARMMIRAIEQSRISGNKELLKQERQSIRDYLSSMNSKDKGINGLTGRTWFDKNGDAEKPLSIGTFYQQNLVSAFTQLKVANRSYPTSILTKKIANQSILFIDGQYMDRTNIVYTGININTIDNVDFTNQTHHLDFYIWFKYRGTIDVNKIHFLNATGPVIIGTPIQNEILNGVHYEMYHAKGTFALNASDMFIEGSDNILGFSFRHAQKTSKNIVYVSDISGMNDSTDHVMIQHLNQSTPFFSKSGYKIQKLIYYSDIVYNNIFGNPMYLSEREKGCVSFSCYNFFVRINEHKIKFRRISWNFYLNLFLV
jgi:ABC-type branched-chain amino acid transport systems, periplasmic component